MFGYGKLALDDAGRTRISEAVRRAEAMTNAELVCVVAQGASEYRFAPVLWASVLALILPWPLWWFTTIEPQWILVLQLAAFCLLLPMLSIKRLRIFLTPRNVLRMDVERAAERQFHLLGIMRTRRRDGILIYVSLAERVALILSDEAVRSVLTIATFEEARAILQKHIGRRSLADGYVEAIECLATALAPALPAQPNRENELPDTILET